MKFPKYELSMSASTCRYALCRPCSWANVKNCDVSAASVMKVVFQIQVARGALVCVSACLDSGVDGAATGDAAVVEELEADVLRMHRDLESDGPMATRASGSESFIAGKVEVSSKVGVEERKNGKKICASRLGP
jgi:hypothetical protein